MSFWTVTLVLGIVAISWGAISQIVRMGVKYSENVERIKHGYPTLNGDTKHGMKIEVKGEGDFIDMTEEESGRSN